MLIRGRAELVSGWESHETGKALIYKKYPRYEAEYGVRGDGWIKYILVVTPTRIRSWGL